MRFAASQEPFSVPCVFSASKPYSEQLGVKRHCASGPHKKVFAGDSVQRYTCTAAIKMA